MLVCNAVDEGLDISAPWFRDGDRSERWRDKTIIIVPIHLESALLLRLALRAMPLLCRIVEIAFGQITYRLKPRRCSGLLCRLLFGRLQQEEAPPLRCCLSQREVRPDAILAGSASRQERSGAAAGRCGRDPEKLGRLACRHLADCGQRPAVQLNIQPNVATSTVLNHQPLPRIS